MFKITNTSESSGAHKFEITLRGQYVSTIRSEKKLREVLLRSINAKDDQPVYWRYIELFKHNDLLAIMRDFGMVSQSRMID